jgi:hypothetical protein
LALKAINAIKPKLKEGKGKVLFWIFDLLNTIFCSFGRVFVDEPEF